ncbi:MAG: aromatic-ring-hydroxylating dioxygenase subunit beta [Burkholderiales bacterium]|jgi:salicylate 5-hydroxylase small subunit
MSAPSTDGRGAAGAARSESRGVRLDPALRAELDALYADYAAALDEARWDDWIALFADDCSYLLQPRENHDRGLPLATMRLESKGMLRDRIVGITETLFHAPYYQRHVIGPLRVLAAGTTDGVEHVDVQAAYAVHRTRVHEPSEVFNVGRYLDRVVRDPADGLLRFAAKRVVFDSENVLNSVVYPI